MTTPRAPRTRRLGLRAWDWTLFTMGFLLTTALTSNIPGAHSADGVSDVGMLLWLLHVAAWVTVFFRRDRPWLVLSAGLTLTVLGGEYLLFLIGVFHVLLLARARVRWWVGAGATVIVAAYVAREILTPYGDFMVTINEGDDAFIRAFSVVIAVIALTVTYAGAAVTVSRRATAAATGRAHAEHARVEELGDQVARQSEREDIAREIHDGLTNRLALLAMMGSNVEKAVDNADPHAPELARALKSQSREALNDLRGLVQGLRASPEQPPAPRGTMREVGRLIGDAQQAGASIHATVLLEGMAQAPAVLDAAVHRMVQESITNALKHAPGTAVSVFLEASPAAGVRLRVSNPLVTGPDPGTGRGAGAGLVGIAERAKALHGTAWTGAYQGEFIVDVTLPWTTDAVSDAGPTVSA